MVSHLTSPHLAALILIQRLTTGHDSAMMRLYSPEVRTEEAAVFSSFTDVVLEGVCRSPFRLGFPG